MPLVEAILLIAAIAFGGAAVALAFAARKYALSVNKDALKIRATAMAFLALGFVVHTFGDFLEVPYGENIELAVESMAHVILLVAFIILALSAKSILKKTQEYWLKQK